MESWFCIWDDLTNSNNAAGEKVQKVVTTASPPNTAVTDYQGGFQYKMDCQACGN
jgi:hypothetical protein